MKKILTSVWFALAIGLVGFGATLGVLWGKGSKLDLAADHATINTNEPPKSAEAPDAEHGADTAAAPAEGAHEEPEAGLPVSQSTDPGMLSFNNPEVSQLIEDLQNEREQLKLRMTELDARERRIEFEKKYIGSITQKFLEAKALILRDMTNRLTVVYDKETNKLRQLAMIYTNMPPSNAVAILDKMSVEDIARILEYMKEQQKAAILENFATNQFTKESRKATEISERLRRLAPEPKLSPEIEPTKNSEPAKSSDPAKNTDSTKNSDSTKPKP
jgi:flagellar motility protein MotE (MotC chaperone)